MEDSTSSSGRTDPRDAKPRLIGGSPSGFTLDTSGSVTIPRDLGLADLVVSWSDLSPLAQGYIEALAREVAFTDRGREYFQFARLAPETLARIIADCERFLQCELAELRNSREGRWLWNTRQNALSEELREDFPPLTPYLGDDGRVYLRAPSLNPEAE